MQSRAQEAALALHKAECLSFQMEKRQLELDLSLASGIQQMLLPTGSLPTRQRGQPGLTKHSRKAMLKVAGHKPRHFCVSVAE